jgi:spore coat polysaccharide biosynthesis protein SpsF (cytidylyltransferase family)
MMINSSLISAAKKPKVYCFLQARMSSNRLPGKVLKSIAEIPLILLCVMRLESRLHEVIVLTSEDISDQPLCNELDRKGIKYFRGNLSNVYDRFYKAVEYFKIPGDDIIVRLTADNPVPDADFISIIIDKFISLDTVSYIGGAHPFDGLPYGLNAEVFKAGVLRSVGFDVISEFDKEHVTPAIKRLGSNFSLKFIQEEYLIHDMASFRFTVDTIEDLENMNEFFLPYVSEPRIGWLDFCLNCRAK